MKDFVVLLVGITIGAIVALLFAPERGEDLRMQLHERAGQDVQRLQTAYQKDMDQMSDQMAKMQSQFQDMQQQVSDRMGRSSDIEESQI